MLSIFQFLTLGLAPGLNVTKRGDDILFTTTPRSAVLQNFSPIAQTVYEICVTKVFHFLALGGKPLDKSSPKGEMTRWTTRSTILQNFILLRQPTPEISLTKNPADRQTKKQTVNDISTACLSACVDNKQTNSKRYIPNMPIGMWG